MRPRSMVSVAMLVGCAVAPCVVDPSGLSAADFIAVRPSPSPKVICLTGESDAETPWSACRDTAVPSGFRVPWTWSSSQAQLSIVSDGKSFGEVPLFSAAVCDEDPVFPILSAIEAPHFCSNRIGECHLLIRSEPELLPLQCFREDRPVDMRSGCRPCCWVTVPNLAIDENSAHVISVSSNVFVVAGRIYFQEGSDGWEWDSGPTQLSLLLVDCEDVNSACDENTPAPHIIAAEGLGPGGFVSYVAVTRQGEYRMGMISPAGILSPTRAVMVKEAYRAAVDSYVEKLYDDSDTSIQGAPATILDRNVPPSEAVRMQSLTDGMWGVSDFLVGRVLPADIPRIFPGHRQEAEANRDRPVDPRSPGRDR